MGMVCGAVEGGVFICRVPWGEGLRGVLACLLARSELSFFWGFFFLFPALFFFSPFRYHGMTFV